MDTISLAGLFNVPLLCYVDGVAYARRLYESFWKYRENSAEGKGFEWLSLCCLDMPYHKLYKVRDVADSCRELAFARRQLLNVKKRRVVGWHNLEMYAILPRERDLFYHAVEPVWIESKSSRALSIPTPAVLSYVTDKAQSRTDLERDLVQKVSEV